MRLGVQGADRIRSGEIRLWGLEMNRKYFAEGMFEIYEGKQTHVYVYIFVGIHVSECLLGKLLFPRFFLWLFRPKATCMSLTRDIIGLCVEPRGIFDENHSLPWDMLKSFAFLQIWNESKLCRVASCDDFVQIFSYQVKHRDCFCGITVPWPLTSMWSCPAVEAIVLALLAVPRCRHWRRGHNEVHLHQGLPSTSPPLALAVALEESKCPTCHGICTEALHPGCGEHAGFGCWSHSPATQWDRVPMLHGHQEADLGFCRLPLFARINRSTTHSVIHSIRVFIRKCPINGFLQFWIYTTTLYRRCCPWPSCAVCLPAVHELKGTLHVFHWQVAGTDRTSGCPSSAISSPAIPSDSAEAGN